MPYGDSLEELVIEHERSSALHVTVCVLFLLLFFLSDLSIQKRLRGTSLPDRALTVR